MPSPFDPPPPFDQPLRLPGSGQFPSAVPALLPSTEPTRRVVFISHSHLHESETKQFLKDFQGVFIARHIGVSDRDDFIESTDADYVMRRIREKHIGGGPVTIVLVGSCTHSRRYVDWEIKASLQQGKDRLPNGLLAIQLPSCPNGAFLPPRLEQNWPLTDASRDLRVLRLLNQPHSLRNRNSSPRTVPSGAMHGPGG